jgi:hypothetical protein
VKRAKAPNTTQINARLFIFFGFCLAGSNFDYFEIFLAFFYSMKMCATFAKLSFLFINIGIMMEQYYHKRVFKWLRLSKDQAFKKWP